MRVDWVVPARYAEHPGDGTLTILGGGIDAFFFAELPAPIAIFLAMRIAGPVDEWLEVGEDHELSVKLVRPDREEETMLGMPLAMPEAPPLREPGIDVGFVLPALMTWEAGDYGLYTLELYIDGRRERSVAFSVRSADDIPSVETGPGES